MIGSVLITGTSSGIGLASAQLFASRGVLVHGFDIKPPAFSHPLFVHHDVDVRKPETFPDIEVDAIVNNAGTIVESDAIEVNLVGYINVIDRYGYSKRVRSVLNVASISGHCGLDTPRYAASQGARLAYSRHLALTLGLSNGTRVNSLSPGATVTCLEPHGVHPDKEDDVAKESILGKWQMPQNCAEWIFFITCVDDSMAGQDVVVDNGEMSRRNYIEIK